jgi:hypothetical protein
MGFSNLDYFFNSSRSLTAAAVISMITLFSAFPARSQESALHIRNAGGADCGRVTSAYEAAGSDIEKTAILNWITGYTTSQSAALDIIDVFPLADSGELVQMVILVCSEGSSARLRDAIAVAIERLRPLWVSGSADTRRIDDGTGVTVIFSAAVEPLQRLLAARGASISIDGEYGGQTGTAVQTLTRNAGLPPIQRPTGVVLYLLTRP